MVERSETEFEKDTEVSLDQNDPKVWNWQYQIHTKTQKWWKTRIRVSKTQKWVWEPQHEWLNLSGYYHKEIHPRFMSNNIVRVSSFYGCIVLFKMFFFARIRFRTTIQWVKERQNDLLVLEKWFESLKVKVNSVWCMYTEIEVREGKVLEKIWQSNSMFCK